MRTGGRASACTIVLTLLATGCVAPASDPEASSQAPPQSGPVVPGIPLLGGLHADVSNGAEPVVLASKSGGLLLVGDTAGIRRSSDNGTTWLIAGGGLVTFPSVLFFDGIVLAEDDNNQFYAATTNGQSIEFARSLNGGASFSAPPGGQVSDVGVVADRPWVAARGDGTVSIIYFDAGRTNSEACLRSTDKGSTWPDRRPLRGSPQAGSLVYDNAGVMYFMNVPDGIVYRLPDCLVPSAVANLVQTKSIDLWPGGMGATGPTALATDGTNLYAAAPTPGNGAIELVGLKPDMTTTKRLTVSPGTLLANTYATTSASGDEVAVAWYGSATAGNPSASGFGGSFHVFVTRVKDFWTATPTTTTVQVTSSPMHTGQICMAGVGCPTTITGEQPTRKLLDYFGIDHDRWGGLHVAYGDDSSGSAKVKHARLLPWSP